jgi:CcmD family protein
LQIDIFVASVAYWVIIGGFLLILGRRVSKVNQKIEIIEKRLKKEK